MIFILFLTIANMAESVEKTDEISVIDADEEEKHFQKVVSAFLYYK